MTASTSDTSPTFGFITVTHENSELVGGFLLLNSAARPLEFHCTAPVKPNRAQEILYGPTLQPYLRGDLIAITLLGKTKRKPLMTFTDDPHVLAARNSAQLPILCVFSKGGESDRAAHLESITLGNYCLAVELGNVSDHELLKGHWEQALSSIDLLEPFDRIREAIREARTTRQQAVA